jgi:hypothetical protein
MALKNDFREVDKAMFQGVERPCELILCIVPCGLIFCLLNVLRNDFSEADETMFQGVEKPRELIFPILGIKQLD